MPPAPLRGSTGGSTYSSLCSESRELALPLPPPLLLRSPSSGPVGDGSAGAATGVPPCATAAAPWDGDTKAAVSRKTRRQASCCTHPSHSHTEGLSRAGCVRGDAGATAGVTAGVARSVWVRLGDTGLATAEGGAKVTVRGEAAPPLGLRGEDRGALAQSPVDASTTNCDVCVRVEWWDREGQHNVDELYAADKTISHRYAFSSKHVHRVRRGFRSSARSRACQTGPHLCLHGALLWPCRRLHTGSASSPAGWMRCGCEKWYVKTLATQKKEPTQSRMCART